MRVQLKYRVFNHVRVPSRRLWDGSSWRYVSYSNRTDKWEREFKQWFEGLLK